jgi:uncharacterized protein (TIGR03083 family)
MLDLDAARTGILREMAATIDRLERLDADGWARPTRLEGWTVGDLAAHLAWGQALEAEGLRRMLAGAGDPYLPETRTHTDPAATLADLTKQHADLAAQLAAVTGNDLARPCPLPYGPVPTATFLQVIAMEVGVHGNDLAAALGDGARLPADVVSATAAYLSFAVPLHAMAATEVPGRPLAWRLTGPTVDLRIWWDGERWAATAEPGDQPADCTVTGDDDALVLFVLGRVPAAALTATDPGLAADLGRYVPGP